MPINKDIKKVMVIGSGPVVIGQAAEFDYAGTQACRALKEEGLEVVLVNSNPATIMTDGAIADKIYLEPLTLPIIKRIIEKERPDSLLSTLGGQTGLTLSMQLAKEGFLDKMNVKLLGAVPETIDRAEDRKLFKETMEGIGQPCIPSTIVTDEEAAFEFAKENGYPLIIRPAFTLGGSGGGIVHNDEEMHEITRNGLRSSPIGQVLVEKSVAGWKEIEFEVIRDGDGNCITVCSMENMDPVGVHTGDSIVIAPAVTLSPREYSMLRNAALSIVNELKIEGGCNCQFALHPDSFEYAVIEVNPRVSRSSALASKATGYPIAKMAAKIAIGYRLQELANAVTGVTSACCEPTVDYCAVKFPKWPFDKFVYAKRELGTQMKATGEVMSIGTCFEAALMKAVRGAEIGMTTLSHPKYEALSDGEVKARIANCDDERLFIIYQALKRGISIEYIYSITKIDEWFLNKIFNLIKMERALEEGLDEDKYLAAKRMGFLDSTIEKLSGTKIENPRRAVFKTVDTCAAEFAAQTPYFYSTYDRENEAAEFKAKHSEGKKTVIIFGAGPIRIGQGIEFDYASVHCVWALKRAGFDVVIVNNNPETVSTDFDTADRLYFEPLTPEDVMNIIETEKPWGVVVAFGGQTAIKLTKFLYDNGINILGTSWDSIDMAEDRERFDELLERTGIKRAEGLTIMTTDEALEAANKIGYPVLLRPSYVLGGQNMIIAHNDADVTEYMEIILRQNIENPVLIDKYLMGVEIEVDAVCDGEDILVSGIMEHIERTGIHSGDSIAVYPAWNVNDQLKEKIIYQTKKLAEAMKVKGLVNIQYIIYEGELYIIEVNPRSSRTVPYISKVTGVPLVDLATRAMVGEKIADMGWGTGLYPASAYVAVKAPVFSFEKLAGADNHLGPEMKSTGEVLGLASTLQEALYKALVASGLKMKHKGGVFISVRNSDKSEVGDTARRFADLGFKIYATKGTAAVLEEYGIEVNTVDKIHENRNGNNTLTLIESGKVDYVVSTSAKGRLPERDSVKIRRYAVEHAVPCLTSLDTANALADCLRSRYSQDCTELVDINNMRKDRLGVHFTKMHGSGNDYIYFNCFDQKIANPAGLSVLFSDRHLGIGGDGVVMIYPSDVADAKMVMYNRDGSEGKMCGNAARCVAKYIYDNGIARKEFLTLETASGIRKVRVAVQNGKVLSATVDLGKAKLAPADVPVKLDGESVIDREVMLAGEMRRVTCVSMGNPHCVIFVEDGQSLEKMDIEEIGRAIETDPLFPERVNVEFVKVHNKTTLKMRVWERGSGETWACGTGACAAAVAAVEIGRADKGTDITVKLKGGDLVVRYTDDAVFMTGNATKVYDGVVEI